MAKRLAAGAAGVGAAIGGIALWDYQTRSKMRKLRPWAAGDAAVHARNAVVSHWPASSCLPTYSLRELRSFDGRGSSGRTLFSAGGAVYDVSGSDLFQPDGPYGKQFSGRDATVALARMSLRPERSDRAAWDALTPKERQALSEWTEHFDQKYKRVGRLKEWSQR